MADKKITALTSIGTGIAAADLIQVIDDVAVTPTNKKMTVSNFTAYLPHYLGFSQAAQAITTSVAVNTTTYCTTIATGVGNLTGALGAGTPGQVKFITMISDGGGTYTLTPALLNGAASTITFADDGDACTLLFTDTTNGWSVVGQFGVAIA